MGMGVDRYYTPVTPGKESMEDYVTQQLEDHFTQLRYESNDILEEFLQSYPHTIDKNELKHINNIIKTSNQWRNT